MESFIFMCLCAVWGEALRRGNDGSPSKRVKRRRGNRGSLSRRRKTASVPFARLSILGAIFARAQQRVQGRPVRRRAAAAGGSPGEFRGRKEAPRSERLLRVLGAAIAADFRMGDGQHPWQGPAVVFKTLGGTAGG